MLKRTVPAVSFTTSHRALAIRSSRPLFGNEMNSTARFKAAWDELPMTGYGFSNKQRFEWARRQLYELGLRDQARSTKSRQVMLYVIGFMLVYLSMETSFWACYLVYYQTLPDRFKVPEVARQNARNMGVDVYCADGKFVRPYFHLNAPMFTMTVEDL